MDETTLLYESATPIPTAVQQSALLLSAARIYTLRTLPVSQQNTDTDESYQHKLRQSAKNKLQAFCETLRANNHFVSTNDELFVDEDLRLTDIVVNNSRFRSNIVI